MSGVSTDRLPTEGGTPSGTGFVHIHPHDTGAQISIVEIAGVHCGAHELRSKCGGAKGQCLVLSFAFKVNVGGQRLVKEARRCTQQIRLRRRRTRA